MKSVGLRINVWITPSLVLLDGFLGDEGGGVEPELDLPDELEPLEPDDEEEEEEELAGSLANVEELEAAVLICATADASPGALPLPVRLMACHHRTSEVAAAPDVATVAALEAATCCCSCRRVVEA